LVLIEEYKALVTNVHGMVMFEGIMQQRGEKLAREEKKQIKKHS
jgi:hypothetical protein